PPVWVDKGAARLVVGMQPAARHLGAVDARDLVVEEPYQRERAARADDVEVRRVRGREFGVRLGARGQEEGERERVRGRNAKSDHVIPPTLESGASRPRRAYPRGSRASRRASPTRLIPSTTMTIASPGKVVKFGSTARYKRPRASIMTI